ncbi:MAG: leucine-rich repeat domain-containing protein [Gammaproteobacteria bacterium]|nr:leucine-rich repeat domain-containing protein [Gammaproteobacteria bacterium]
MPYFPSASDALGRQGFVRVINHSDAAGEVAVEAFDDEGTSYGPVAFRIAAGQTVHFNSNDLEDGNAAKGLTGSTGAGLGAWRLVLDSELDIEVLSYIRTTDGFLTAMHDTVPTAAGRHEVAVFNPGSNLAQQSLLRLVNVTDAEVVATIAGTDDGGASPGNGATVSIPGRAARTYTAAELEAGGVVGLAGSIGDGSGKWRLLVESAHELVAMSLLSSPTGHLTNLSTAPDNAVDGVHPVPLFPSASDPDGRQGFVRVINRSDDAGEVTVRAFDETDRAYESLTLEIGAAEARHFNSDDLELGNTDKGLTGSTGAGEGDWRLELTSGLDLQVLSYIRTDEGFLTAMHDVAPRSAKRHRVAVFNPGSNVNQRSLLRLVNPGSEAARVTVVGIDGNGASPGSEVVATVPAGGSRTLSALELETGGDDFEGALGDGAGKWSLTVTADRAITAMSLLSSPTGHLTNLTTAPQRGAGPVETAAEAYEALVAPMVQSRCVNCHVAGGESAHTPLVFATASDPGHLSKNLDVFEAYVGADPDNRTLLLDKIRGDADHGGGVQVEGGTNEFASFDRFMGLVAEAVYPTGVCLRTPQVRAELVRQSGRADCAGVTDEDLSRVSWLELGDTGVERLASGDFAGLHNLRTLLLRAERELSYLPGDIFAGLTNLQALEISYTAIEEFPVELFAPLEELVSLQLYSNGEMRSLAAGLFEGLSRLRDLNLDNLPLGGLPGGLFAGLDRLESLWMRNTRLTTLPPDAFSGLPALSQLWLAGGRLAALPAGVFRGTPGLSELSLGDHDLRTLPPGLFSGLANLRMLDLAGNPGAPFPLTVELTRTDASDLAPGPADLVVRVREGAPFGIKARLVTVNGSTASGELDVDAGATESAATRVEGSVTGATHVGLRPLAPSSGYFTGLEVLPGPPLALFAESDKQWPAAKGEIPAHVLTVGSPEPEIEVAGYFSHPDGAELTYSVEVLCDGEACPDGAAPVAADVAGSTVSLVPRGEGTSTAIIAATDPAGLSAWQEVPVTVFRAPEPDSFQIGLVFDRSVPEEVRTTTRDMAERWMEIVTGDLDDIPLTGHFERDFDRCGSLVGDHRVYGPVDDVLIFVRVAPVRGGKGYGGHCALRAASRLPYAGRFVLDTEQAASQPEYTILHELGHVLGFGTVWEDLELLEHDGDSPYFTGPLAVEAYNAAGGADATRIPVSPQDWGHWHGDAFGWDYPRELMIDGGGTRLSAITIQSMADLGYVVDVERADPFELPGKP